MKTLCGILIVIIAILIFVISEMYHTLKENDKNWEKYVKTLRKHHDIITEEKKKDIAVRDELLKAYTYNKVK